MSILVRGRAAAEARMTSRCTIRRKTGEMAQDEDTGREYPVWEDTYTALPCRLGGSISGPEQTRTITVPGGEIQTARRAVHFPASTTNLRDGDLIEVTVGENTGLVLVMLEADWSDQKTARRVPVEAVQRPEEWDL